MTSPLTPLLIAAALSLATPAFSGDQGFGATTHATPAVFVPDDTRLHHEAGHISLGHHGGHRASRGHHGPRHFGRGHRGPRHFGHGHRGTRHLFRGQGRHGVDHGRGYRNDRGVSRNRRVDLPNACRVHNGNRSGYSGRCLQGHDYGRSALPSACAVRVGGSHGIIYRDRCLNGYGYY